MSTPSIRQMRRIEQKTAAGKAARRGIFFRGRYIERSTGNAVRYCPNCNAPVVASQEGLLSHYERMPECRRRK